MRFKLVLVLCTLGTLGLISSINAMIPRSPGTYDVRAGIISDTDQQIMNLIQYNNIKGLEDMLKNDKVNANSKIVLQSILHWAIHFERLDIVKLLIEYGAQVSGYDIFYATKKMPNPAIVKVLEDAERAQEEIR